MCVCVRACVRVGVCVWCVCVRAYVSVCVCDGSAVPATPHTVYQGVSEACPGCVNGVCVMCVSSRCGLVFYPGPTVVL